MGGGSKSYSGSAQKWAQPFAKQAAGDVTGVYNANAGNLANLSNLVSSQASPLWARANAGSDQVRAAQGYASDVLGGNYLQGNPYLQDIINQTNSDVADQVNSQFAMAGRFNPNAAFGKGLGSALAQNESNLRYTDYGNQQQRMDQIAALSPTLAQADYIGIPEALQATQVGAQLPYTGINAYSNALGTLFNGGTQKQSNGIGGIIQGVGSLASGAAMFSDPRLKVDIDKHGELDDGLGVYEWTYVWGGPRHIGVMADEVATLRPWALGPEVAGFKTVNYEAL